LRDVMKRCLAHMPNTETSRQVQVVGVEIRQSTP
jgi:hypothetical protein